MNIINTIFLSNELKNIEGEMICKSIAITILLNDLIVYTKIE